MNQGKTKIEEEVQSYNSKIKSLTNEKVSKLKEANIQKKLIKLKFSKCKNLLSFYKKFFWEIVQGVKESNYQNIF